MNAQSPVGDRRDVRPHGTQLASVPRVPADLTSPLAKLVYVHLSTVRRADVIALSRAIQVPQIRLYPVLQTLVQRGHVEGHGSTFAVAEVPER